MSRNFSEILDDVRCTSDDPCVSGHRIKAFLASVLGLLGDDASDNTQDLLRVDLRDQQIYVQTNAAPTEMLMVAFRAAVPLFGPYVAKGVRFKHQVESA